jgi:hypothetical protein
MGDGQLFSWDTLMTITGASLLVFLIVQYTKSTIDRYTSIPTDIYTVVISFCVLVIGQAGKGVNMFDWKVYAMAFFNAFIVASTSSHVFAKSLNPPMLRPKQDQSSLQTTPLDNQRPELSTTNSDSTQSVNSEPVPSMAETTSRTMSDSASSSP